MFIVTTTLLFLMVGGTIVRFLEVISGLHFGGVLFFVWGGKLKLVGSSVLWGEFGIIRYYGFFRGVGCSCGRF